MPISGVVFWLTIVILAVTVMLLFFPHRTSKGTNRGRHGFRTAFAGLFTAGLLLHFPIYYTEYADTRFSCLDGLLSSLHHTLRMFVLDGELEPIRRFAMEKAGTYATPYFIVAEIVYIAGPLLTFSVVLSFFKNISAYGRFYRHVFSKTCIFSELNERSLCLARSIKTHHPETLIAFTDVYADGTEASGEAQAAAAALGAVCFRQDIIALRLSFHKRTNAIRFFIIGTDEDENIRQSAQLIRRHGDNARMELYIFSDSVESSLLLQTMKTNGMKLRRISDTMALINEILYKEGQQLFENAACGEDGEKVVSAVVLGMGGYGTEMLKALAWFGQMDGYRLMITAIDLKKDAAERFTFRCPELMSSERNGVMETGEAQYSIEIHSGIDALSEQCVEVLAKLPTITYCFAAMGDDRLNIEAAVWLREFCERRGFNPEIQALVYSSAFTDVFRNATNFRGMPYHIHCVGSIRERYTEEVILTPTLEKEALARHLLWGDEDTFWRYEFNYRSSTASALHRRVKLLCKIPGAELPPEKRSAEDRDRLRLIEHRRWNSYMRTEGYRYSGSRDKKSRNDLAKLHNDLVPFDQLTEAEKAKDDV